MLYFYSSNSVIFSFKYGTTFLLHGGFKVDEQDFHSKDNRNHCFNLLKWEILVTKLLHVSDTWWLWVAEINNINLEHQLAFY